MNGQIARRAVVLLCLMWAAACASPGVRCNGHLERINGAANTKADNASNVDRASRGGRVRP